MSQQATRTEYENGDKGAVALYAGINGQVETIFTDFFSAIYDQWQQAARAGIVITVVLTTSEATQSKHFNSSGVIDKI